MKMFKSLALLAVMLAILGIITGCSAGFVVGGSTGGRPPQEPASSVPLMPVNGLVQSSEGGSVTIDVRWMTGEKESLVFKVAMDTHSVDLDGYDFSKLATLRDDTGRQSQAISWDAPPGGHHRSGTLTFPSPVSLEGAKYLEMVIRDVAGVPERVLRWQLE